MHHKAPLSHFFALAASLLASSALGIEWYLLRQGKSLCQTSACAIVAQYLRFSEPILISIGAGGFLILAGLIFFADRYRQYPVVRSLPFLSLLAAASFDGALLGFQFITIRQHCQLCITVALSLAFISLLYAASRSKWSIAAACLLAWASGFLANAVLIMPDTTDNNPGMVFYERKATDNTQVPLEATLIFSLDCPHCTEVLEALAKQNPTHITWRFALIDRSLASTNKLGYFYANLPTATNPFQLLLETKASKGEIKGKELELLPQLTRQARMFLSTNGLRGVPALVVREPTGTITMTIGASPILDKINTFIH